ncbi:A1pp-domain-containing protein [Piromyces finnis]|uniref:A1pp-domain-containing protein n=1 Tax=Piromyces finnis TaxID=1754191 RepID=A0A1Y1V108_9FUNG|nr:A1pp-domain-containing protein [Piromyces finnis]|eukprot:ORX44724.1 A1pp-domain-containing protein [Piromyces finnis]
MKFFNVNLNSLINVLINYLLKENSQAIGMLDESSFDEKFNIYKSLCNVRYPNPISNEYLENERKFFEEFNKIRNLQTIDKIEPISNNYPSVNTKYKNILSLWQGDITTLKVDAIVNAANSQGLGCFQPSHICIDNLIHTYAGVALRLECNEKMKEIKYLETGKAFITSGQNLPSKHVIHTVGPIIENDSYNHKLHSNDYGISELKIKDLSNCYLNSLKLANENNLKTIAFPCISTGLFRFPQELACKIAIETVIKYLNTHENNFERIIFNVYKNQIINELESSEPMSELDKKVKIIKELLNDCDSILIGAGAGLSLAAGLDEAHLNFEETFKDFIEVYHIKDIYSGGFQPFSTLEEKWGYFSRNCVSYIDTKSTQLYENILKLVKNKEYFVITTNVDGHFEKSGFDTNNIFATQGDFINLQCSVPCHNKLYESIDLLKEMVKNAKGRFIPTELIPKCPKCGKPMTTHLRIDSSFVMDDYWYQQNDAYNNFINKNKNKKLLLLEFGVGFNTPSIIRFPFERETLKNENWNLIRFNKDFSGFVANNMDSSTLNDWDSIKSLKLKNNFQNRFIPIADDINEVINKLL